MSKVNSIIRLTPELEERIQTNVLLNIDTFIIPSPFIKDPSLQKDYEYSYVWMEEGEILGYILVYSTSDADKFLIYKLVTSPHGRGRGIGTRFIESLAKNIPKGSRIYLYVWEKQHDTVEFFRHKGFEPEESTVYQNMVYHSLSATRELVLRRVGEAKKSIPAADEIGRTRHDARKTLSSLTAMVNALAPENAGRIIEDINRETTTLINMLNMYRDSMAMAHEVNIQELILERLVPYVKSCGEDVELTIVLSVSKPLVLGHWLNIGRALVNLASNSIDAMVHNEGKKCLTVSLTEGENNQVILQLADNGEGIPEESLIRNEKGVPAFVGKTTKASGKGEGLGTTQVWNTFGPERLNVESQVGKGTRWFIRFEHSTHGLSKRFATLQRRFHELEKLVETLVIGEKSPRKDVITAIWRLRQKEIFLFELLEGFSRHHNIRNLFRIILSFWQKKIDKNEMIARVQEWKGEDKALNGWLSTVALWVMERNEELSQNINLDEYGDELFKSYAQSLDRVIIFTLNPVTKQFLATDRKLAEHLDFVAYLGKNRDSMLRGEFVGDVAIDSNPIFLGVWSVDSEEDVPVKLQLLQDGAQALLALGIPPQKKLAFYQSTYIRHSQDIDSDKSSTLGEFSKFSMDELIRNFIRDAEDEMQGFLVALD